MKEWKRGKMHVEERRGSTAAGRAGFSWFGATPDLDVATFDAMFASNVRAAFFLVAAFAPGMAARGKGSIIIVHGRDAARGAETVDAITAAGGQARFVGADLSDPADLQRLVKAVGEIDILVNNAGFSWFGATPDLKVETFDALFAS